MGGGFEHGDAQAGIGQGQRTAQAGDAGAHDDDIVAHAPPPRGCGGTDRAMNLWKADGTPGA
ncbi:MAG: hypothetical protein NVS2B4_16450 [Ramlibacter sp.]